MVGNDTWLPEGARGLLTAEYAFKRAIVGLESTRKAGGKDCLRHGPPRLDLHATVPRIHGLQRSVLAARDFASGDVDQRLKDIELLAADGENLQLINMRDGEFLRNEL